MGILAASIFTISGAGIFLIFGLAYLYKSISVKNHCSTIQKNIDALNLQDRTFLFALMKGVAGGAIAFASTIIFLQLQYIKQPLPWIPLVIVISNSIFFLVSLNAMMLVKRKTTVKPPIVVLLLSMLFIILGFLINIKVL